MNASKTKRIPVIPESAMKPTTAKISPEQRSRIEKLVKGSPYNLNSFVEAAVDEILDMIETPREDRRVPKLVMMLDAWTDKIESMKLNSPQK